MSIEDLLDIRPKALISGFLRGFARVLHLNVLLKMAIAGGIVTGVNLILMIVTSQPS